jgi:2-polyprenyl-6-methoxyphenol hydroxylase-like FAD-dependent oxidoreductase
MSGKNLSIAIIGAGMGGLAAAGSLCRAGFSNVHVYEQATRFNLLAFYWINPLR